MGLGYTYQLKFIEMFIHIFFTNYSGSAKLYNLYANLKAYLFSKVCLNFTAQAIGLAYRFHATALHILLYKATVHHV